MRTIPGDLKYTSSHEWVRVEANQVVTMGITDFAQEQLGDIVFVELPEAGVEVTAGDPLAVVESVKAASDLYAPVSGKVIEVNSSLEEAADQVNSDPYENGWFVKIQLSDTADLEQLLDPESYQDQCSED